MSLKFCLESLKIYLQFNFKKQTIHFGFFFFFFFILILFLFTWAERTSLLTPLQACSMCSTPRWRPASVSWRARRSSFRGSAGGTTTPRPCPCSPPPARVQLPSRSAPSAPFYSTSLFYIAWSKRCSSGLVLSGGGEAELVIRSRDNDGVLVGRDRALLFHHSLYHRGNHIYIYTFSLWDVHWSSGPDEEFIWQDSAIIVGTRRGWLP